MTQARSVIRLRSAWGVMLIWSVISLAVFQMAQSTKQRVESLEALSSTLNQIRIHFYVDTAHRASYAEDIALNIQLAQALQLQLEAEPPSWFDPDLSQLLYSTSRYLEQAQAVVESESALVTLTEAIREQRMALPHSAPAQRFYQQLSTHLLEAILLPAQHRQTVLRELDRLYLGSDLLNGSPKSAFRQLYHQTLVTLTHYTRDHRLIAQLLQPSLSQEMARYEDQYHQRLFVLGTIWCIASAVGLLLLYGLGFVRYASWKNAALMDEQSSDEIGRAKDGEQRRTTPPMLSEPTSALPSSSVHFAAVDQHLAAATSSPIAVAVDTTPVAIVPTPSEPELEIAIDFEEMLESLDGNTDAMCELLGLFISEHQHDAERLIALVDQRDPSALRLAHSLKGVAGSLGANQLHRKIKAIELEIKAGVQPSTDELTELSTLLDHSVNRAQFLIERYQQQ